MKRKRFNEVQILNILKEGGNGTSLADLTRKHGICEQTYYRWKSKYGGLELNELKRLKALEEENRKLKRLVADQALDILALKDINSKNW